MSNEEEYFRREHFTALLPAEDDCEPYALLVTKKANDCCVDAELWELQSWCDDGDVAGEVIANVMLKWDGCGHWTFSEGGYQHLCGRSHVKAFGEALLWAFDALGKEIPAWDAEVAS